MIFSYKSLLGTLPQRDTSQTFRYSAFSILEFFVFPYDRFGLVRRSVVPNDTRILSRILAGTVTQAHVAVLHEPQ